MALSFVEGTFTEHTSTGSKNIPHGLGTTPQLVILFGSDVVGNGNSVDSATVIGVTDTSTTKSICMALSDSSAVPNFAHAGFFYNRRNAAGTQQYRCNFTSVDATNIVINVTIAPGTGAEVHFIAIAGLTNAALVQWTTKTSTGAQSIVSPAFEPDLVFNFGVGLSAAPSSTATSGSLGISFYDGTNQWGQCGGHIGGGGTAGRYQSVTDGLVAVKSSGILYRGAFTGMTANGFDVSWAVADGTARYCFALCLKGGLHEVGSYRTPTSTDANYPVTGLGLVPIGLMQASIGYDTLDNKDSNTRTGIGAASSTSLRGAISGGKDGAFGASDSAHDSTKTLLDLDPGTPTVDEAADLVSFDAGGGFTQNVSVADSDQDYVGFWTPGNTPVTPSATLIGHLATLGVGQ